MTDVPETSVSELAIQVLWLRGSGHRLLLARSLCKSEKWSPTDYRDQGLNCRHYEGRELHFSPLYN